MQKQNDQSLSKRVMAKRKSGKGKSKKFSTAIQSLRRMKTAQRCNAIRFANDEFIRDIVSNLKKLRNKKLPP